MIQVTHISWGTWIQTGNGRQRAQTDYKAGLSVVLGLEQDAGHG